MTPEETTADETGPPRFRERRSAHREDDAADEPAPAPESPILDRPGAEPAPPGGPVSGSAGIDMPGAAELTAEPAGAAERPTEPAGEADDLDDIASFDLPAPSFLEIVELLATQALQFLGDAPIGERGERRVFPQHAKHVIDLLGILEERTRGNLADEEREYLVALLDELRTRYLRVAS